MDSDELLKSIRVLVRKNPLKESPYILARLQNLFEELDQWIESGKKLPKDWTFEESRRTEHEY